MKRIIDLRHRYWSLFPRPRGREWHGSVWDDVSPIRAELIGAERLEQHARRLAAAQPITSGPPPVPPLRARLKDNAGVLLMAYRATVADAEAGRAVVPAIIISLRSRFGKSATTCRRAFTGSCLSSPRGLSPATLAF